MAHQIDAERQLQDGVDDGETEMRIGKADLGERQVERRHQRLVRDHHAGEEEEEPRLLARHLEAGQPVAGGHR